MAVVGCGGSESDADESQDAGTCPDNTSRCGSECVALAYDPDHCGVCGQVSCQQGLVECEGSCENLETSVFHCGQCSNPCSPGQVCSAGV